MSGASITTSKKVSRRAALAAGLGLGAAAAFPAPAAFAQRRKIVVAYGSSAVVPIVNFSTSVPIGAGFFADEGLDVETVSANVSSAAIAMLTTTRAQFVASATNAVLSAVDQGIDMKSFICQVPDSFYSVAVLPQSKVTGPKDLKGQQIGVPSLSGGTILLLKAVLRQAGLNPETDVEYISVGNGLPAVDALQRDRVNSLFLWDEPYALFEAQGISLRYISPDPIPKLGFTFATHTSTALIQSDPGLVAAMARALSRSLVFCAAAPVEELCKLHFRVFPEARSSAVTELEDVRIMQVRLRERFKFMRFKERVFDRTERLGDETDSRILLGRDLLLQGGELKQNYPVEKYFTRQFVEEMNKVDVASVIAKAKAFRA